MLPFKCRQERLEIQSFLGGELYYNTKIKPEQQSAFINLLKNYFAKLENALAQNKSEPTIVQEVLKKEFFEKFKDYQALMPYEDDELDADYKQGTREIKVRGAVDFVLKKEGSVFALCEAKKPNNKAEMIDIQDFNKKALHEAILYYFREKENAQQKGKAFNVRYIIITDFYHFFFFKGSDFEKFFYKNEYIENEYKKYKAIVQSSDIKKTMLKHK